MELFIWVSELGLGTQVWTLTDYSSEVWSFLMAKEVLSLLIFLCRHHTRCFLLPRIFTCLHVSVCWWQQRPEEWSDAQELELDRSHRVNFKKGTSGLCMGSQGSSSLSHYFQPLPVFFDTFPTMQSFMTFLMLSNGFPFTPGSLRKPTLYNLPSACFSGLTLPHLCFGRTLSLQMVALPLAPSPRYAWGQSLCLFVCLFLTHSKCLGLRGAITCCEKSLLVCSFKWQLIFLPLPLLVPGSLAEIPAPPTFYRAE